ncbi:MAG: ketoacyl-ACP synthase III, partial [Boseongicola sp. SB0662_bin_57]|nr:ketoacyl-ACP synthase III [Boseongicola sp. SB0662_bin_57]
MTTRAVVQGVGHYLPERVIPNSWFENKLDTSDEWIRARTGIESRHFAADGEAVSELATKAALAALAAAGRAANDIDAVIVATSTPDLTFPSAATIVQGKLGMTRGFAFDVQAVCAGFVFGLSQANALIVSGQARRILVIGAETFSSILDWHDRTTCVLFGDGAGAVLLEVAECEGSNADRGILATDLHSDGRYRDILYVDGGVSTQEIGHLRMQGREVFRHAVEKLARTAQASLDSLKLTGADVDWLVPHQANLRIIKSTAQKLGLGLERVVLTVQEHGNTSAASIPLALSVGVERGQIKPGDLLLTEAIGG